MRFFQIVAATVIAQARFFQQAQHLRKSLRAIVARMVVGQAYGIKVALHVFQTTRMHTKHIGLLGLHRTHGGHHAFQIAKTHICALEQMRHA